MDRNPPAGGPTPFALVHVLDALDVYIQAVAAHRNQMGIEERTATRVLAARLRYYAETIDVTFDALPEAREAA